MKKLLLSIFCVALGNLAFANTPQAPLIVEFATFKEAEKLCGGSDYTKIACLVEHLRPYANRIYTKHSGQNAKIAVLFYALNAQAQATYPPSLGAKYCEFTDTLGRRQLSTLSGNGFSYVLDYHFRYSSSLNKAFVSCYFMQGNRPISQTTQGISVIPNDFDINLTMKTAQDSTISLNAQDSPTPNASNLNVSDYETPVQFVLKAQTHSISINPNATARTLNGAIDEGFSGDLVPVSISFNRDNGLCNAIGESANGAFSFKEGRYAQGNVRINFLDVARGELEIILAHNLDSEDRAQGKCLSEIPSEINITNAGKIPCQSPIIIKKRVEIVPHSFFVALENNGKQMYYNQHTFAPAISYLPVAKLDIRATNDRNQLLKNFTGECFARTLSIKLEDGANNLLFINENMPDSLIPKETFLENSTSRVVRNLSSSGIKDRDLTPADAFHSQILSLNDMHLSIQFYDYDTKYPVYIIKPKISNDWRIALLRGRIRLLENTNESPALVANPKVSYEFYCKSPVCNVMDIESVIAPSARFPKAAQDWFVNTAHPAGISVAQNHLILGESLRLYSLGSVVNGVQTLAIESTQSGIFDIQVRQGSGVDDFALFLYFAPSYINVRQDLGVRSLLRF